MSFEISRYTTEDEIPDIVGDQIAAFFAGNYPPEHEPSARERDLQRRKDGAAVLELLNRGRTIYTATTEGWLVGLLESGIYEDGIDPETTEGAVELLCWLMTEQDLRGQGIASAVHAAFIADAMTRTRERRPKRTDVLLGVNEKNPAKNVYEHWGYREQGRPEGAPDIILMSKPLQ